MLDDHLNSLPTERELRRHGEVFASGEPKVV
jgi:hypothetical protein